MNKPALFAVAAVAFSLAWPSLADAPDLVSPKDATAAFRASPVLPPFSYTVIEMAGEWRTGR